MWSVGLRVWGRKDPLHEEYTLKQYLESYLGSLYPLRVYSLVKGYWALWVRV